MDFASTINCMDGRTQEPVINWIKDNYDVKYVDMITEAGPIKIISENSDICLINSIKERLNISINIHGSKLIAIVGHYDCARNPENMNTQVMQIRECIKIVKHWYDVEIIGLWVNENWQVEKIKI
ncbi:carbonic anhydrase [Thermodesulfobium sp. 4217-1]|uniref:carbonic anhydrase n=1 Tax=Thermodesulfobium sp. 4217-1 TaxID=3120013 RepID=UPI003221B976